jgi:lipopolysaccharide/colanic/teichoic acid biosynthesis glycosyltransferase
MATEGRSLGDRRGSVATIPEITLDPRIDPNLAVRPAADPAIPVHPSRRALARPAYDIPKRIFDFGFALVTVLALLPLMLLVALLIRLDSRGPVFFKQERLGKNLRPFGMLKFRTMRMNSESIPRELLKSNESTGPLFKMRNDPRITRVGWVLRRTSLDELPQLFNVLLGQMSIVGPRPPLPRELDGFDQIQRARLQVMPGLTGLWQVSGRSNLPFDEMVRLDLLYVERRSLLYDLKLVVLTIPSVLLGRGAY